MGDDWGHVRESIGPWWGMTRGVSGNLYRPLVEDGWGGVRESISPWWGMTGGVSGNL